jgi:hypothetical protein
MLAGSDDAVGNAAIEDAVCQVVPDRGSDMAIADYHRRVRHPGGDSRGPGIHRGVGGDNLELFLPQQTIKRID